MSKRAFNKITEGLTEALAIAKGEAEPARLHVPDAVDVQSIRAGTGLSQEAFAAAFGFTVHQIRQWEQGRNRPVGALRAYLIVIARNPKAVLAAMRQEAAA